jgi:hypothetical protein
VKYKLDIEISLPREQVFELFTSRDDRFKWQEGLQIYELVEGQPGEVGATSRVVIDVGFRKVDMVETITNFNAPTEFIAEYETTGVESVVRHVFLSVNADTTKWESHNEFRFSGLFIFAGVLMESQLKNQSRRFMQDFKAFAEEGQDVRDRAT